MKSWKEFNQVITEKKSSKKKGDGNLANNYPPYDKVTRGDVIAGAKGEDQMGGKTKKKKLTEDVREKTDYKSLIQDLENYLKYETDPNKKASGRRELRNLKDKQDKKSHKIGMHKLKKLKKRSLLREIEH